MTLSDRIKWARETAGLDPDELAKRVGSSARTVKRWEAGETEPHDTTLRQVARETKVRYEWLREERGDPRAIDADAPRTYDVQQELMNVSEPLVQAGEMPRSTVFPGLVFKVGEIDLLRIDFLVGGRRGRLDIQISKGDPDDE